MSVRRRESPSPPLAPCRGTLGRPAFRARDRPWEPRCGSGDDQVEVPAIAQRAIRDEAADRGQVVRLDTESVVVELLDRSVLDCWRIEALEGSARRCDACRDVFKPCLIGRDLDSLARSFERTRLHDALPTLPGEFVIVPDRNEGPSCAGILQIWIA